MCMYVYVCVCHTASLHPFTSLRQATGTLQRTLEYFEPLVAERYPEALAVCPVYCVLCIVCSVSCVLCDLCVLCTVCIVYSVESL